MSDASNAANTAVTPNATPQVASNIPATNTSNTKGSVGEADVRAMLAEENGDITTEPVKEVTEKQIQELKKKLKLKVNGKEIEREVDFSNEDDMREAYQKAMAAEQTWQEASKIKKQMQQLGEMLKSNPFELMKQAGMDPDELTAKYMEDRLKEYEKSPEQRQLEELQKQVEDERSRREALENEKVTMEQERIKGEYMRDLDEQINGALGKFNLPKTPSTVKRIAQYLSIGLDQGKQLTVDQVVPLVDKSIRSEFREHLESLPSDDLLEEILGENVLNRLKKRRMSRMKEVQTASQVQATGTSEIAKMEDKNKAKPRMTKEDTARFWNKR